MVFYMRHNRQWAKTLPAQSMYLTEKQNIGACQDDKKDIFTFSKGAKSWSKFFTRPWGDYENTS